MDCDILVVGGGHAGIEAALAAAKLGRSVLLVTQSLDAIGRLSCNPAIGGLSKGNIVREIDALGGAMGLLADATMIQFRILNASRGPAVQAPRAQADKERYALLAKHTLEVQRNLRLFQDTVTDLLVEGAGVVGVVTERGRAIRASAVVLTTGTFMEGKLFIGDYGASGGRLGEPAAIGLGTSLRRLGFSVGRLKTGTPARVRRSSLDFARMEEQDGDAVIRPFSFLHDNVDRPQVPCWITYTNEATHAVIRENMHRSPLYGGAIVGRGPRYCPSIEDKVVRFPERARHQIFVEPEGLETQEMYLNGISSSLPEDVQERFLRTVAGLENCEILRPGYAVEYDYMNPIQLKPSLESKRLAGLFVAGQTNGTSGYEEAACQGLVAGINAARFLSAAPPLVLSRSDAYIGVLVDDLVTLGTEEPYRMFTSRAEYRLCLRHDNADRRLTPIGRELGLADDERWERFMRKTERIDEAKELLSKRRTGEADRAAWPYLERHVGETFFRMLRDPELTLERLRDLEPRLADYPAAVLSEVELDIKYEGYIERQERQIRRFEAMENVKIPADFDYDAAAGISAESREKLKRIRPASVGQATRISGVRSPDIAVLLILLGRRP